MKTAIELKMTAEEQKDLETILEDHDMSINYNTQDGEVYSEIEWWSDLDEDCIATIWWDGSAKSFVSEFQSYADDFDPYDHACQWITMDHAERERMKVPSDNKALIVDAEETKELLMTVAKELSEKFI